VFTAGADRIRRRRGLADRIPWSRLRVTTYGGSPSSATGTIDDEPPLLLRGAPELVLELVD